MRVTKKIREEQLAILEETYRGAKPELIFHNPFELLIAVILSAQCTDKRVNVTTKRLFSKVKSPEDIMAMGLAALENEIRDCGLFRNKAKNILLGFVVGFVLACAVVVLRTMLDDTYKSADDIRKYTGMVVLASIPLADAGEQPKEKSEFKRRTKRFADDIRRRVGGSSGRKA